MASVAAYTEIKNLLAGAFPGTTILDFDELDDGSQQGDEAFLVLEEISGSEDLMAFGNPASLCAREQGAILVHCLTPAPEGSAAARAIADNVRNVARPYVSSSLRVDNVEPPDIAFSNDGLWADATTAINFSHDFYYSAQ